MNAIECAQFEAIISDQLDGPLPAVASAHMQACENCRALWGDLEAIRIAGMELGSEEMAPAERVWTSLRLQMESEGLIRSKAARVGWFETWFGAAPRWALAGASLCLLAMAGVIGTYQAYFSNTDQSRTAEALPARMSIRSERTAAVADLGASLDGDLKRVLASLPERNPSLATSLQENLGIVDNLIAICEKTVREQPNNQFARDYLYGAYEQKAVLLATASDRSALEAR